MSQIATTIEQSKRLMGAGVKKESADMSWRSSAYEKDNSGKWVPQKNGGFLYILPHPPRLELDVPAWSLSELWNIVHKIDRTYEFPTEMSAEELIERLVKTIIYRLKDNHELRKSI